jgi:hypothetical protein
VDDYQNFAISTVAIAPSPPTEGHILTVLPGEGARFPIPPFNASVWPRTAMPDPTNAEIVRVMDIDGDRLALEERGAEATNVRAILPGDYIAATVTEKTLRDMQGSQGPPGPPGPAGVALVVRETPLGAMDGVNATFTLMNTPTVDSEQVFLNGLLQESRGADYGIAGNVITFIMPPLPGDRVLVTYARS